MEVEELKWILFKESEQQYPSRSIPAPMKWNPIRFLLEYEAGHNNDIQTQLILEFPQRRVLNFDKQGRVETFQAHFQPKISSFPNL